MKIRPTSLLASLAALTALAGCVDDLPPIDETTSLRVALLMPTDPGASDRRLDSAARDVQIEVTAIDSFGQPDPRLDRDVKVYVEFLGTLTPALGAPVPFATIPMVAGRSAPTTLTLPRVFGPTTLWVEDDFPGGTYPTGTSPILWYQDPYLADISTPRDLMALDALTSSPLQNKQVTVTGSRHGANGRIVATGVYAQGYTVSDVLCADANGTPPCTTGDFDHVLVFSFSRPKDEENQDIGVGQFIDGFSGGVQEFNGLTEIGFPQSFVTDRSVDCADSPTPPACLARLPAPAVVIGTGPQSWFTNTIEFEKHEGGLIAVEGGTVCPLDMDYATYKQWKIDVGRGCGAPINVITAGVAEFDPATAVGTQLTRVIGTLRPVNIGSFNVWIMYPRFTADVVPSTRRSFSEAFVARSFRPSLAIVLGALVLAPALAAAQPRRPPTGQIPPPPPALTEEQARAIAAQAAADAVAAERARAAAEHDAQIAADAAALAAAQAELRAYADAAAAKALADAEAARAAAAEQIAKDAAAKPGTGDGDYLRGRDGFTDTRLNFTLTNENMLAKPGETIPSVPGWRFGRPNSLGTLFFDNYDTRFSGFETMSNAIMYRHFQKEHLEVEAGFVVRLNEVSPDNIALSDAGSYILASWWKDPEHKDPTRYTVTVFPVSADRFRLGYSYRLSWGGNDEYAQKTVPLYKALPGIKLQMDVDKAYAFVGAKSAVVLDRATAEAESTLAILAGAGYDLTPQLRVEVNGGYFNRGSNELEDVKTQDVHLYGASVQVAAHEGMPVQSSIDYKLYKYDPERVGRVFQKAKYPGGTQWLAMAEATYLGQTLKDPEKSGSTKVQPGIAGDVNLRAMIDRMRVRADFQYRDLAFILHSVPSLPTYSDFPKVYDRTPNFFAAVGVDQNFDDKLTLGLILGVELPATLTSPSGIPGSLTETGKSTAVIRNNGGQTLINVLPVGKEAAAAYAFKGSAQYDFGDVFACLVDVYFSYDPNQTRLRRDDTEGEFRYEFGEFNQLGTNVTLQAKF